MICDDFMTFLDDTIWTYGTAPNMIVDPGRMTLMGTQYVKCKGSVNTDIHFAPSIFIGEELTQRFNVSFSKTPSSPAVATVNVYPLMNKIIAVAGSSLEEIDGIGNGHIHVRCYIVNTILHLLIDDYSTFETPLAHLTCVIDSAWSENYISIEGLYPINMLSSFKIDDVLNVYSSRYQANPLDFGKPEATFSLCTVNDGVELATYRVWRNILANLKVALELSLALEDVIIQNLSLVMPSGIAFNLVENGAVLDFIPPETRFWAWSLTFNGMKIGKPVPLPKVELSDNFFQTIFAPLNQPIEGSENRLYKDVDGIIKHGYDINPMRQYYPLSDGIKDFGLIAVIIGLIAVLEKTGLLKTAITFARNMLTYFRTRQMRQKVQNTDDNVISILEEVSDVNESLDNHRSAINSLAKKIGVNFTLKT